mmetsp:Transcript_35426/g.54203  ORF Transcript_35426/g.54203 Transcript_35426/m.54203 type:complete len:95 (+) Transcript_35426:276-560(+)
MLRARNVSHCPQIVFTRKLNHPELIFNENLQVSDSLCKKHIDFANANGDWQISMHNDECYFCGMFPYVQLFFRRSEADRTFTHVTDPVEIRKVK